MTSNGRITSAAIGFLVVVMAAALTAGCGSNARSPTTVAVATSPPAPQSSMPADPTAAELAHGHWSPIRKAPFVLCADATLTGTGPGAALAQAGGAGCPRAAAIYDPTSNSWRQIASPLATVAAVTGLVWSDDDLLAYSRTGGAEVWSGSTNTWTPTRPVAAADPGSLTSVVAWHGGWLAASSDGRVDQLRTNVWKAAGSLPAPHGYAPSDPVLIVVGNRVAAFASVVRVTHGGRPHTAQSFGELLRRTATGWRVLSRSTQLPAVYAITSIANDLVVAGGKCAPAANCGLTAVVAVRLRSDGWTATAFGPSHTEINPLVDASDGITLATLHDSRHDETAFLYDTSTRTWRRGPRLKLSDHLATYGDRAMIWTPAGVILQTAPAADLRHPGNPRLVGMILRP